MDTIPAVYPDASNKLGVWAGRPTLRHDCGCESDCGQIHIFCLTDEEAAQYKDGLIDFDGLFSNWRANRSSVGCPEQGFIIQALVDATIPPEEWGKYTPRLEQMNSQIGGFKPLHIEQLHPDIFDPRDRFYDHQVVKDVRRYLAETA